LGPDSFKFAAMLGSFVTIYKLLLNALPLFTFPIPDFSPPLLPWGAQTPVTPGGYESDPNWSLMTPTYEKRHVKFDLESGAERDKEVVVVVADPSTVQVSAPDGETGVP
jgi:hypothetical protein